MRYLRICSIYAYRAMISLFLSFLAIAILEENDNASTLMLILHKNQISALMMVSASTLFSNGYITVFIVKVFAFSSS